MSNIEVHNINVDSQDVLITPEQLKQKLPMSTAIHDALADSRQAIEKILDRRDHRIFVVVGPCSIHDTDAAMDYARRLKALADELSDTLYIVMRVYFEKPRTTVGWKGLVNDPHLDDSFKIEEGLHIARKLLLDILDIGLPTSTEALDPISPQYLQDLISWTAIGARTTESQTHREMASGLSSAVGFKNGTDGGLTVATNALNSVAKPHRFLVSTARDRSRCSLPKAMPTAISYCAAAAAVPTMIQYTSSSAKMPWTKPVFLPTSWWTAVTPIPTNNRNCSRWSSKTWPTRSWKAIHPLSP